MAPPPEPQWPPVDGIRSFQIPKTTLLPLQISNYTPDTKRACLYFQVLKSYNEKFLR